MTELPTENEYTNEWYRKQFNLLRHTADRDRAELVDMIQQHKILKKNLGASLDQRQADAAIIGSLLEKNEVLDASFATLSERVEKMAEFCRSLKKTGMAVA